MPSILNSQNWLLPIEVITKASLEATRLKIKLIYLSNNAKENDMDFLFYKDEDRENVAFVIERDQ